MLFYIVFILCCLNIWHDNKAVDWLSDWYLIFSWSIVFEENENHGKYGNVIWHNFNWYSMEMDTFNYFSLEECKKNKEAAKKWHDMASAEQEEVKHIAQSLKSPDILELSETQKTKLIDVHRKNLLNEVKVSDLSINLISFWRKDTRRFISSFNRSSSSWNLFCKQNKKENA